MTPKPQSFIAYVRVSTQQQGQSGLGLDAQMAAVEAFARQRGAVIAETFREVESGKRSDRPQLQRALRRAKLANATLVIARLDRLARDAHFLLGLQKSGVRFVAADMPDANELTVGLMAVIAQHEAKAISERTKVALQAAKARGQVLGNPNGAAALRRSGRLGETDQARAARVLKADAFAGEMGQEVRILQGQGAATLQQIADGLNAQGFKTPRGGKWHRSSVSNLLARIAA